MGANDAHASVGAHARRDPQISTTPGFEEALDTSSTSRREDRGFHPTARAAHAKGAAISDPTPGATCQVPSPASGGEEPERVADRRSAASLSKALDLVRAELEESVRQLEQAEVDAAVHRTATATLARSLAQADRDRASADASFAAALEANRRDHRQRARDLERELATARALAADAHTRAAGQQVSSERTVAAAEAEIARLSDLVGARVQAHEARVEEAREAAAWSNAVRLQLEEMISRADSHARQSTVFATTAVEHRLSALRLAAECDALVAVVAEADEGATDALRARDAAVRDTATVREETSHAIAAREEAAGLSSTLRAELAAANERCRAAEDRVEALSQQLDESKDAAARLRKTEAQALRTALDEASAKAQAVEDKDREGWAIAAALVGELIRVEEVEAAIGRATLAAGEYQRLAEQTGLETDELKRDLGAARHHADSVTERLAETSAALQASQADCAALRAEVRRTTYDAHLGDERRAQEAAIVALELHHIEATVAKATLDAQASAKSLMERSAESRRMEGQLATARRRQEQTAFEVRRRFRFPWRGEAWPCPAR